MKRYVALTIGTVALGLLAWAGGSGGKGQNTAEGGTLKVMCHYTGTGAVDDSHKVYITLWDTPSFMQPDGGGMPIDMKSVSSKNGSVTFTDVKASPVYVSAVYDPKGEWDAHSAPPSGASLGLYSKEPGKPAPIDMKSGAAPSIHFSFDDSYKMP